MVIEDGVVLVEVVSEILVEKIYDGEMIIKILKVYELLWKLYCIVLVDLVIYFGWVLYLGEGKVKEERDKVFKENGKLGLVFDKWVSLDV